MMIAKYEAINVFVQLNLSVIWSDSDNLILNNCAIEYLLNVNKNIDIIGQRGLSPFNIAASAGSCLCTGFFIIRPTARSMYFVESMRDDLVDSMARTKGKRGDQTPANLLLGRWKSMRFSEPQKIENNGRVSVSQAYLSYATVKRSVHTPFKALRGRRLLSSSSSRDSENDHQKSAEEASSAHEGEEERGGREERRRRRRRQRRREKVALSELERSELRNQSLPRLHRRSSRGPSTTYRTDRVVDYTRHPTARVFIGLLPYYQFPRGIPPNAVQSLWYNEPLVERKTFFGKELVDPSMTSFSPDVAKKLTKLYANMSVAYANKNVTSSRMNITEQAASLTANAELDKVAEELLHQEWQLLAPTACIWHRISAKEGGSKVAAMARDGVLLLPESWLDRTAELSVEEVQAVLYRNKAPDIVDNDGEGKSLKSVGDITIKSESKLESVRMRHNPNEKNDGRLMNYLRNALFT
jgi:hypothetical protein